jgi:Ni/Co efflux regulator RcnB
MRLPYFVLPWMALSLTVTSHVGAQSPAAAPAPVPAAAAPATAAPPAPTTTGTPPATPPEAPATGTTPVAPTPPIAPTTPPGCLVSGFRSVALQTHDLTQREQKALAWLRANGERCTAEQMANIGSNLGIWLGRAESVRISTAVEGLLQLAVNPDPQNREQVRRALGIPPPPPPPKPKPPEEPKVAVVPPEMPRPQTQARITPQQRRVIARHFATWSGTEPCPGTLVPFEVFCQSAPDAQRNWTYGQPLPTTAQTRLAPNDLLAKLGAPRRGLEWTLLDNDVLLVDIRSRVVIDGVLDLGRPQVKAPPPPPVAEEAPKRPLQTPPRVLREPPAPTPK